MGLLLTHLIHQLSKVYSPEESRAMARRLLEEPPLSLSPMQVFASAETDLPSDKRELLEKLVQRILSGEPFQYVLGHEYFCGLCLEVGPGVLIPRPETQDLVEWVISTLPKEKNISLVDACTGSGCIAAALAAGLPHAQVTGIDVSTDALRYARRNTEQFGSRVRILQQDLLTSPLTVEGLDALVSNPPYIAEEERGNLADNVKKYEPEMALFVPQEDPLLFYRVLGEQGQHCLRSGGAIFVEINQRFGEETCALFRSQGYCDVELRTDRFGNPRMVKGVKK